MQQSTQNQQQVELIIEQARKEIFTDLEKSLYEDFVMEAGIKNPANMTEADADSLVRYLGSSEASNEFVANVINRLVQVAPAYVVNKILLSDNDGDGVPLYQELKMGTKATEYDSPSEVAAARQRQYHFTPLSSDLDL
jgi:hypothetical protein